jgi:hypothetical protein
MEERIVILGDKMRLALTVLIILLLAVSLAGCRAKSFTICVSDYYTDAPIGGAVVSVRSSGIDYFARNNLDAKLDEQGCANLSISDKKVLSIGIRTQDGQVAGVLASHPDRDGDQDYVVEAPLGTPKWVFRLRAGID